MIDELRGTGAAPDFTIKREWQVVRLGTLARIRSEKNRPDLPLLSVFLNRGVIPYGDGGGQVHKPGQDLSVYQVVRRGDLVLNNQQAWRGSVGVSRLEGIISPAYVVLALSSQLDPRFADYLFQSRDMVAQYVTSSKGVGDIQRDIHLPWLKNVRVPVPPLAEQAATVRYLDWTNGRLDRAIRAKSKVIGLLNEQRQVIIHRAVTKGLDPSVPLKPSGIAWLGDVPQHWEVWRISRFAKVGNGSTPSRGTPNYWKNGTYPWLNSSQVNRGYIDSADQFVTPTALRQCHLPRVPVGSVLVAITGQGKTRGTAALLGVEATISQHIAFITPRADVVHSKYLHLALVAAYQTLREISSDSGSTKGALTCEDLKRFKVVLPPLAEQARIVEHMRSETRDLNTTIARLEREIELLRVYRTRLIADVVTGKLDVRLAAAQLPDEGPADTAEEDLADEIDFADEEADS